MATLGWIAHGCPIDGSNPYDEYIPGLLRVAVPVRLLLPDYTS